MRKMWIIGIKSGIITVLGLIAYGLLIQSLAGQAALIGRLEYIVLALGIYSGHYYYKAANKGLMTYRQGLKLGLIVTSFTGSFNGLLLYLYARQAAPAGIERLTENMQKALQQQGVGAPMREEVGQWMQQLTPTLLGVGTFISTVLLGFALTLVVAAFSRSSQKAASKE
ncbi:MAG: DUF4199 domain-containing protein [Bacteroidota bacterium]